VHGLHAATSKVENSAQGSSCQLKFVHADTDYIDTLSIAQVEESYQLVDEDDSRSVTKVRISKSLLRSQCKSCMNQGWYYKTITIIIMMIVSDATIWRVTYDRN
jgi:hypothetical protein